LFLRARNFGLGGDNGDFDYTQLQMIANAKAAPQTKKKILGGSIF